MNKVDMNTHIQGARAAQTDQTDVEEKKIRRKERAKDSLGKGRENTLNQENTGVECDPLKSEFVGQPNPNTSGDDNGFYFFGPGLMAYAAKAMSLEMSAGFAELQTLGKIEESLYSIVGKAYDNFGEQQKQNFLAQAKAANGQMLGSIIGASLSFGLAGVTLGKAAWDDAQISKLKGEKEALFNPKETMQTNLSKDGDEIEMDDLNEDVGGVETGPKKTTTEDVAEKKIKAHTKYREALQEAGDDKAAQAEAKADLKRRLATADKMDKNHEGEKDRLDGEIKDKEAGRSKWSGIFNNFGQMAGQVGQAVGQGAAKAAYIEQAAIAIESAKQDKIKTQEQMVLNMVDKQYTSTDQAINQDIQALGQAMNEAERIKRQMA